MKYLTLAILSLTLAPSFAADAPKPPACGATVAECQKQVDFLSAALQGAQQQRDAAQKALADSQLQEYAAKVTTEAEKKAKKDK